MNSDLAPSLPTDAYDLAWATWITASRERGEIRRQSAREMYRTIWFALKAWAQPRRPEPLDLDATDLFLYLEQRGDAGELSLRYAWRFCRLVERILAARARQLQRPASSAVAQLLDRRPDIRHANASRHDGLPEVLATAHASALLRALRTQRRAWDPTNMTARWAAVRDFTAAALQLFAGLAPGEIRGLTDAQIRQVARRIDLHLPPDGNSQAHIATLEPWLARVLRQWLELRRQLAIPGAVVFPATRTKGQAWSKVAHYDSVKRCLKTSGVEALDGGSFRLRHSYAVRALRRGHSPDQIAAQLGVSDPDVLDRYQRLWHALDEDPPLDNKAK